MNTARINITVEIDEVTLEYHDKIKLIFNPTNKDTIPVLEELGEYIRNCSTVNIIDSNRKNTYYCKLYHPIILFAVLEIYFEFPQYSFREGSNTSIKVRFTRNQSPFSIVFTSYTVNETADLSQLEHFINFGTIIMSSRAAAGKLKNFHVLA